MTKLTEWRRAQTLEREMAEAETVGLRYDDLRERYGLDQLPPALGRFIEFVATLPEEGRRQKIDDFIDWIFTLDLRRLGRELAAIRATPLMRNDRCDGCESVISDERLRTVVAPGVFGRYCATCAEPVEARIARRLERRSIRSALHRARAARLPATLTEDEWAKTCARFDHLCAYCGDADWYVVEHATPIDLGGGTTVDNCVPECFSCTSSKGSNKLEAVKPRTPRIEGIIEWLRAQGRRE